MIFLVRTSKKFLDVRKRCMFHLIFMITVLRCLDHVNLESIHTPRNFMQSFFGIVSVPIVKFKFVVSFVLPKITQQLLPRFRVSLLALNQSVRCFNSSQIHHSKYLKLPPLLYRVVSLAKRIALQRVRFKGKSLQKCKEQKRP